MTKYELVDNSHNDFLIFPHQHLLSIETLTAPQINHLLNLSNYHAMVHEREIARLNRQIRSIPTSKSPSFTLSRRMSRVMTRRTLKGYSLILLFFETSTRTRTSFELAGKRLGADTVNISVATSAIKKGETLIDTAMTLNAMHPDVLVVRHPEAGAVNLLARHVNCAVINAGDGGHEHPTQALIDALTIQKRRGQINGLTIAICGDILHSRVARSNIHLFNKLGARVRLIAPPTLLPTAVETFGVEVFHDMRKGLKDVDVVMMLRLQQERMQGTFVPSTREYFHLYGLDKEKLAFAKPDALIMHPGPMNRGVEIDSTIADDITRSVILDQVELGVAVRQACIYALARNRSAFSSFESNVLNDNSKVLPTKTADQIGPC